jgi:hypothetical protein
MRRLAILSLLCTFGAAVPLRADTSIVFNEIMYHPATNETGMEWVEFYNQMAVDVDISGWSVAGGIQYTFPSDTIVRGRGYLLLALSPGTMMTTTGLPNVYGPFVGRLSNNGDDLQLRNNSGRVVDSLSYGIEGDWPVAPDGSGVSLAKRDRDSASGPAADWTSSEQMGGTPGMQNFISGTNFSVPAGLVSYWSFNETSGTSALDQAGQNQGTLGTGVAHLSAGIGRALSFNGTSDAYVNVGSGSSNNFAVSSGITIEALLLPGWSSTNSAVIFKKGPPKPVGYRDAVLTNNPVAYWRLGDTTTSMVDTTANGHIGTAVGSVLLGQPGLIPSEPTNTAIGISGSGRITIPGFEKIGPSGYTVEYWLKVSQFPGGCCQNLVGDGESAGDFFLMNYLLAGGAIRPHYSFDNSPVSIDSTTTLQLNNSYHIVTTWDAGNAANNAVIYINGVADRTGTVTRNLPAPGAKGNNTIYIGPDDREAGTANFICDEVALYNHPLTAADVSAHYAAATITNFDQNLGNAIQLAFQNDGKNGQANPPVAPGPALSFGLTVGGVYSELDMPLDGQAGRPALAGLEDGQSHHVAATYNSTTGLKAIFVDGVQRFSTSLSGSINANNSANAILGNSEVNGSNSFVGTLDEVAFWNRALSGSEIAAHSAAVQAGRDYFTPAASTAALTLAFNELSAAANAGFWLELINYGTNAIPLAGYVISCEGPTNNKYIFPAGPSIASGGYYAITNTTLGFEPVSGDKLYLLTPAGDKVLDAVVVKQTPRARSPEATGPWLRPTALTPGGANAFTFHNELVINEILYHPPSLPDTNGLLQPSSEAWLELYNRSSNVVDLTGWSLAGGIHYQFPGGKVISPGGYLVIAQDAMALQARYPAADIIGNFGGGLSHGGELIVLNDTQGNPANQVHYYDAGHWPAYADGGGSSLELRDPKSDNSQAEAWAASDESGKSTWQSYSYRVTAQTLVGPQQWNDFILGLLDGGECLVDDISVLESPTNIPLQFVGNGNFENGLAGWRVLGTHNRSRVEAEPGNPANHVLHVIASGPQEHMHNHIETTFLNGHTVTDGREYQISFRAKWCAGNNLLNTRLYFNRIARTTALPIPMLNGTPGAQNSCYTTNAGPTFTQFQHRNVIPQPNEPVTVSVVAQDSEGVASCSVFWSANGGAWSSATMTPQGGGFYSGTIPGFAAGTVVQFHVRGTDGLGATATYPASGTNSGALYTVADGQARLNLGHNVRIILSPANTALLHAFTNVQSNDNLPCTVVYDEQRAYYDMGVRLKGSERARSNDERLSFHLQFRPDDLFRGVHPVMLVDRSSPFDGDPNKQQEIVLRHMLLRAGGIPGTQPDMCRVIAPLSTHTGPAIFSPRHEDEFIATAYENGGAGNEYELELIYYPITNNAFGYKNPQPDAVTGVDISDLGDDKESYRYDFIIKNHREVDDYSRLTTFAKTFSLPSGPQLDARTRQMMDVDEWTRAFAFVALCGVYDTYTFGNNHNLLLYVRPSDQKLLAFPWDMDYSFYLSPFGPLIGDQNLSKIFNLPANRRALYAHALDIVASAYNTGYMAHWVSHYQSFAPGQDYSGVLGYIQNRISGVNSEISNAGGNTAFAINGPTAVTTSNNLLTLSGTAPIQVKTIKIGGIEYPVTWTSVSGWTLSIPVNSPTNVLNLLAYDLHGNPLTNFSGTITVTYTGAPVSSEGKIVFNEIMYHPVTAGAAYVELLNTSSNLSFDLSGWRINGLGYAFPPGSIITNRQLLVLAKDLIAFGAAYGSNAPAFDQFSGKLQTDGETLTLLAPGAGTNETIMDQVRYETQAPWPATTPGVSLQLVDAAQDNSRVANWTTENTNALPSSQLLIDYTNVWKYMQVSNLDAVAWYGTNYNDSSWPAGLGLLAFEDNTAITPLVHTVLTDPRTPPAGQSAGHADYFRTSLNLTNNLSAFTLTASTFVDDGAILYVNGMEVPTRIRMVGGAVLNSTLATGAPPGGDATNPDLVTFPGSRLGMGTNVIAVEVHQATTSSSDVVFGMRLNADLAGKLTGSNTPGIMNSVAATLPAFPSVWLNEAQADNVTGPLDNFGQHDPWVELYNHDTNVLSLAGFYLSDNYTNLAQWSFPSNASVPPGGFLVVWCDNQTNQTATNVLHTNFRLGSGAGNVVLSRVLGSTNQILDYVNYTNLPSNRSYGDLPDGQPFFRTKMFLATPGGTNNGASAPIEIYINEWMADNAHTIANPLNGAFDDWFELYNPSTNAVDLGGYYLTGALTNKTKFLVPNNGHYIVQPQGHFMVWADNNGGQNSTSRPELHVNFKLSKSGEAIGLFTPEGTAIDAVTFGPQTTDASEGRFPDGAANRFFMPTPTPGAVNIIPNTAPLLTAISNRLVHVGQTVAFTATATDAESAFQTLNFSLDPGAPVGANISTAGVFTWTTANAAAPGTNSITVRVTDNGTPPLSNTKAFLVVVQPPPQFGAGQPDGNGQVNLLFSTLAGRSYQVEFKDNLTDFSWTALGGPVTGTGNPVQIQDNLSGHQQRFYRIFVLP